MAALGGRLLEKQKHQSEAAAAIRLRSAGDQATLGGITETLDRGLTQAVALLNVWIGATPEGVEVILNNLLFLYDRGELLRPETSPQEEREMLDLQAGIQAVMQAEG